MAEQIPGQMTIDECIAAAEYEPGKTCPECGALVGHWKPCYLASPELQERWRKEAAA